jgi:uncharacterized repeat protein (TIGR03803 family)
MILATLFCAGATLSARSQSGFSVIHHFAGGANDGAKPANSLLVLNDKFYGTTQFGGASDSGTVFSIGIDGLGFANLHSFSANADGKGPVSSLTESGGRLYGVALQGGASSNGTIYGINTDGSGFAVLHHFFGGTSDGSSPYAAPVLSGSTLYGATYNGGSRTNGIFYSVNTNGAGYLNVYNFTNGPTRSGAIAGLTFSNGRLYGANERGGSSSAGYFYSISTNGNAFTNLHTLTGGANGSLADATPLIVGNRIYGVTFNGIIIGMNNDGTGFTVLHALQTATEGNNVMASLLLAGDTLYGTASSGGVNGAGTLFCVRTNGTGFLVLHSFTSPSDGGTPFGGLTVVGDTLYGLTYSGGSFGNGTIYSLNVTQDLGTDQLGIAKNGQQMVLYWPAWATNVVLQSTTDPSSGDWAPFTNGTPIVGLLTTNSGSNAFFRLQRP